MYQYLHVSAFTYRPNVYISSTNWTAVQREKNLDMFCQWKCILRYAEVMYMYTHLSYWKGDIPIWPDCLLNPLSPQIKKSILYVINLEIMEVFIRGNKI